MSLASAALSMFRCRSLDIKTSLSKYIFTYFINYERKSLLMHYFCKCFYLLVTYLPVCLTTYFYLPIYPSVDPLPTYQSFCRSIDTLTIYQSSTYLSTFQSSTYLFINLSSHYPSSTYRSIYLLFYLSIYSFISPTYLPTYPFVQTSSHRPMCHTYVAICQASHEYMTTRNTLKYVITSARNPRFSSCMNALTLLSAAAADITEQCLTRQGRRMQLPAY
jgi:hypothetical protein